jgi:hypothetical protein
VSRSLVVAVVLIALGCATPEERKEVADAAVVQTRLPGTKTDARLELLAARDGYLDVAVETGGKDFRFFLPDTEECRAVANAGPGEQVRYVNLGTYARLELGEQRCDVVGILSLATWRDRRPRIARDTPVPRVQATYHQVYADEDVAFLRGWFPLTGDIGLIGSRDTIAVVPRSEPCEGVGERSVSSLEFKPVGSEPYTLINGDRRCPILGFAQPLDDR